MDARRDADLARTLVARGVANAKAIAHAQTVQARQHEPNPITELLVELEHVDESALADALCALTGAPRWDGGVPDPELTSRVGMIPRALPLSLRDGLITYATTEPHDDETRQAVLVATGARRAHALVTTYRELAASSPGRRADAQAWRGVLAAPLPLRPASDETVVREQWRDDFERGEDLPIRRLAFGLLIQHTLAAPGGLLRVEAFESAPAIRPGCAGRFEEAIAPTPTVGALQLLIWQLAELAELPPTSGCGDILLLVGTTREIDLTVAATERGPVAIARRHVDPRIPPRGPSFELLRGLLRQAVDRPGHAQEEPLRRALLEADASGDVGVRVHVRRWLAQVLDDEQREHEAQLLAEEALDLARRHGLGARADASLRALVALMETTTLERRIALMGDATAELRRPGPAFVPALGELVDLCHTLTVAGRHEEAIARCNTTLDADLAWHGARAWPSLSALMLRTENMARLGQPSLSALAEVRRLAVALEAEADWREHHARGVTLAALGRAGEAVTSFDAALADLGDDGRDDPWKVAVSLDLARTLEAAGMGERARTVAAEALRCRPGMFAATALPELDAIRHRSSPYR